MIKEFIEFYKLYKRLDVSEMTPKLEFAIKNDKTEYEEEINKYLLYKLSQSIIKDWVNNSYAEGFKAALILRLSLKRIKGKLRDVEGGLTK